MTNITVDSRNEILHKVSVEIGEERLCPYWSMRYIQEDELKRFQLETCIEYKLIYIKSDFPLKERREEKL